LGVLTRHECHVILRLARGSVVAAVVNVAAHKMRPWFLTLKSQP
jgi:hypothetical protein